MKIFSPFVRSTLITQAGRGVTRASPGEVAPEEALLDASKSVLSMLSRRDEVSPLRNNQMLKVNL